MFANISDASKSAYAILVRHLKKWNYQFIDCQTPTNHLKSLGAKEVSREYFLARLDKANQTKEIVEWKIDNSLIN